MKLELSDKKEVRLLIRALEVYHDYVNWRLDWDNEEPFQPKEMIEIAETTQTDTEHLIKKVISLEE